MGRWRYAVVAIGCAAGTASGWVYHALRSAPEVGPPSAAGANESAPSHAMAGSSATPAGGRPEWVWHGRVTRVREKWSGIPGLDRQCLVEYPVWNIGQMREYTDGIWFWVPAGAVTDRRTGRPGEVTAGQRVTVWHDGTKLRTAPPQSTALRVVIEPETPLPHGPR